MEPAGIEGHCKAGRGGVKPHLPVELCSDFPRSEEGYVERDPLHGACKSRLQCAARLIAQVWSVAGRLVVIGLRLMRALRLL